MFKVWRCTKLFDEVWRQEVAEFDSLAAAEQFADREGRCDLADVWYEVDEVN